MINLETSILRWKLHFEFGNIVNNLEPVLSFVNNSLVPTRLRIFKAKNVSKLKLMFPSEFLLLTQYECFEVNSY